MKYLLTLLLSLSFLILKSQNMEDAQIETTQLTDNIYMLQGYGGNIAVFTGDDGLLMVDGQFAPLSPKILAALGEISDEPLHYLVNTHWHGDHTGGNENFANEGAVIISHENVRERLSTDQVRPFRGTTPAAPQVAWPAITFDNKMQVHFNSESIKLIHVDNAHTDGDAMVYFPLSNVLHTGDCFFNGRWPYVDLGSGGSPQGAIKAVEAILMLVDDDTQVIPGHGPLGNKQDLLDYHNMYTTMRTRVQAAKKAGKTVEQALADNITKGYEEWAWSFITDEKFVGMMFESY